MNNLSYRFKRRMLHILFIQAFFQFNFVKAQEKSIILGRPTDTSITASILFEQPVEYFIEYGISPGKYNFRTSIFKAAGNIPDEIDLKNLTPNTRYFYRLQYRANGDNPYIQSPEYTFHTQRAKGSSFTFTIEADEHLYDKKGVKRMYQTTLDNQARDSPDFMLSLGDIFGDDHYPFTITSGELDTLHKNYRPFLGSICHSIPFYVCLGNHEGENDYYYALDQPNNLSIWGTKWRKFYYPNPFPNSFYSGNDTIEPFGIGHPENYYAWNWGDALFVVLDVYRDQCDTTSKPQNWDWSLGWRQYSWLKNILEGSKAQYKFVFAHHIRGQGRGGITNAKTFEWGGLQKIGGNYTFPNYRPGWAKPIHQLFKDNGVNIFFQGHDHVFAHEVLDNVVYQSAPMAADSTYKIGMLANAAAFTADTVEGTGHIRVRVSPACINVDFVRAYLPEDTLSGEHKNGEIGFSYTLGNCNVTAIRNIYDESTIKVYPNPASNILYFLLPKDLINFNVRISNMLGITVLKSKLKQIDISQLPNGFYVCSIESNNRNWNLKLIIKH